MNHYSQLLYYFKQLLESDKLVNTVTQGDLDKVALDKLDIFTLAHIVIGDGILTNGQTVGFNCQVACIDIVDINNEITDNKFFKNNNEVDVYNETFAVINRFWTKLNQDFERKGIKTSDNARPQKWVSDKDNAVGYYVEFDVEMPNRAMSLCQ